MPHRVAFVLKGYPRLSETFIAQEILGLERRGLDIVIVSLRHPTEGERHPVHRAIKAPIVYLPEYLAHEPRRVLRAWWAARRLAGYGVAWRAWLCDLVRDPTPNRVRRFGQALVLAVEVAPNVASLHAHFLHTPASVTRYAALLTGLPWTCSAHAKDIWTTPDWEKREKLAACRWLVTCTQGGADHLAALAERGRVELVYHGLDLERFAPGPAHRRRRDGGNPGDPVVILCVGRAVPKKGLEDLLDALALLPAGLAWRLVHIGGGPLMPALRRRAERLGLVDRITWRGARAQDDVIAAYREADLFALTVRIAEDGDRDGLPNVLLEAQSQGLAVVSTAVSAVPEFVTDEVNGVLVTERDRSAIAGALARLIQKPDLRERMGRAGEARVRRHFGMDAGLARLAAKFGIVA
ncbi:MAG: colanic acid biosynthesis glycosyltransferase WcaL [Alphaproteobacteria bacterium]|nr:colanic acid biosynthesis glycosyltransferase WcaL [Alphaproteobacteria bacterium]